MACLLAFALEQLERLLNFELALGLRLTFTDHPPFETNLPACGLPRTWDERPLASWYGPGVTPTLGERYEFEDFVGARFTATLDSFSTVPMEGTDGVMDVGLRLTFTDHPPFETNLPVRFRDA